MSADCDTIKILLATDNHIGYMERDPIRGQDAIRTFEEILKLALKNDVDMILLAGDLFHENKPSRDCIYRVIALLREYTMGEKPVQIELLSDPDDGKATGFSFPAVNYEDPNLNVGIPVFSIHGNHDDPQGAGPDGALCALDLLSVSGLLNYMGKIDLPTTNDDSQIAGIDVRPVLLRKGSTRLGLYGIGNVKDARMHFELRSNRVRMFMPRDKNEWFNILLLHQNRVKRGPQESVPEGMFDDSINLVVWGHEHDCRIVPEPVAGKEYYITQPGSSVATSLSEGESLEKHAALIEIHDKEFRLIPLPLRTVRPFVMDEIHLTSVAEDEGFDANDQIAVSTYLKSKVNELIGKANKIWEERNERAVENGEEACPPMLPLIRLKVDTTDVIEMSNPIRFGQEFQGKVANPRDILIFHRSKRSSARTKTTIVEPAKSEADESNILADEKLARVRVETLVREYLQSQEMQILGELGMSDAIQTFVEKDDSHAIQNYVNMSLRSLMKGVQTTVTAEEDDLNDMLQRAREEHEEQYRSRREGKSNAEDRTIPEGTDGHRSADSMAMDEDEYGSEEFGSDIAIGVRKATKKKGTEGPGTKRKAYGRGKKVENNLGDEVSSEDEMQQTRNRKATTRAGITASKPKQIQAKGNKPTTSQAKQLTLNFVPSNSLRPTRAAKGRAHKVIEIGSDED